MSKTLLRRAAVPSTRFRTGRWPAVIASMPLALAVLVSGCATRGPNDDLPTISDQTKSDRASRVRLELASNYFARGQNATALDEVKLALQADPRNVDAYNLRGLIYAAMGETRLAEESFNAALRLDSGSAGTRHNYGWFLCQHQRYADAQQQFQAALNVDQYRGRVQTMLAQGVCQARDNRWAEAEGTLIKTYELDPSNPVTAYNLADVLYRRKDYERARFYIRRVNTVPDQVNAQSLWLALRIEHAMGQSTQVADLGQQLRSRFPESPEALLLQKGQFDE